MGADEWVVRAGVSADVPFVRSSLAKELVHNSYLYGVRREAGSALATATVGSGWPLLVVTPAEFPQELAGWVMFRPVPAMSVAFAYVDPHYRGLGAWRAMRDCLGLQPKQQVNVVLGSPMALKHARDKYTARHNWGQVLEWLL